VIGKEVVIGVSVAEGGLAGRAVVYEADLAGKGWRGWL